MTWKEFKEAVEIQDITDDMEISYIDWPSLCDELDVKINKDNSFSIS